MPCVLTVAEGRLHLVCVDMGVTRGRGVTFSVLLLCSYTSAAPASARAASVKAYKSWIFAGFLTQHCFLSFGKSGEVDCPGFRALKTVPTACHGQIPATHHQSKDI